eukprot:233007-Hanusia_phi.AAC.1
MVLKVLYQFGSPHNHFNVRGPITVPPPQCAGQPSRWQPGIRWPGLAEGPGPAAQTQLPAGPGACHRLGGGQSQYGLGSRPRVPGQCTRLYLPALRLGGK